MNELRAVFVIAVREAAYIASSQQNAWGMVLPSNPGRPQRP
jgi:hypothetical protein